MKFAHIATWIVLALPAAAAASAQARPAAAPGLARVAQLDIMADLFVPRAAIFGVGRELCDTSFRTELDGDPQMAEVQNALPGLVDRMVKTASSHCDVEMNKVFDRRQEEVRTYWAAQVSPADLARLAHTFTTATQEARAVKVEVHPGDSMKDIITRMPPLSADKQQRLRAAQLALARTPGGIALINKVHAYQVSMQPLLVQDQQTIRDIATDAVTLAHRDANLFAQEKGLKELYADAPVPPLSPAQAAAIASAARLSVKLPGSFVYIYSFLDVREDEYTPKVLDQFDADLTARLAALNVSSKILRFNQSSRGKDEFVAKRTAYGDMTQSVPVGETIDRNLADERATKARYRLVVFPANFTMAGFWRFYDIRFVLMDTATGTHLWEYVYSGKHMVVLKDSENAEARAKKILDHAFAEMKAKGLL